MAAVATQNPPRERKLSMGAPISSLMQAPVGPVFSRPKHKRTFTGFGAGDIKSVEASIPEPQREAYESATIIIAPQVLTRATDGENSYEVLSNLSTGFKKSDRYK